VKKRFAAPGWLVDSAEVADLSTVSNMKKTPFHSSSFAWRRVFCAARCGDVPFIPRRPIKVLGFEYILWAPRETITSPDAKNHHCIWNHTQRLPQKVGFSICPYNLLIGSEKVNLPFSRLLELSAQPHR
jgi:hypothetical protein